MQPIDSAANEFEVVLSIIGISLQLPDALFKLVEDVSELNVFFRNNFEKPEATAKLLARPMVSESLDNPMPGKR